MFFLLSVEEGYYGSQSSGSDHGKENIGEKPLEEPSSPESDKPDKYRKTLRLSSEQIVIKLLIILIIKYNFLLSLLVVFLRFLICKILRFVADVCYQCFLSNSVTLQLLFIFYCRRNS